jgi:hypothetical protein
MAKKEKPVSNVAKEDELANKENGLVYHLFACEDGDCLSAANPAVNSQHQRGLHSKSGKPPKNVACPGCGKAMKHILSQTASDGAAEDDPEVYTVKEDA